MNNKSALKDACSEDLQIIKIETIPYVIPLRQPIKWARGAISDVDNVLLMVTLSDGTCGIADAPSRPTILGDTQKSIVAIIDEHIAPALIGTHVFDLDRVWNVLNTIAGNPAAKGAVDLAIHDAQGKAIGVSCAQLLGGSVKPLPVNWRIHMASHQEMLAEADAMISQYGFRAFKVKGNRDYERDVDFLRELRKQCGDKIAISIDFNQSLTSRELLSALPRLEAIDIELIEEPLPARDAAGKLLCARATHIPLSGDDSCLTTDDVLHELQLGAVRSVVIKVARNGYRQARDIVALGRSFYTPMHNGSQADMHIGAAASAHFACTYESVHSHEFSTFLDAKDYICDRDLTIKDGYLFLPEGPGIGLTVDAKKLEKYRVDK